MLSNTYIKRLSAKEKVYRLLDDNGLYIEVKPNGKKFWRYRSLNSQNKPTMISLGEWPEVKVEDARIIRDSKKKGAEYAPSSFEEVALKWLAHQGYSSEKNEQIIKRRLEIYLFPKLGKMLISDIKPANILPILKAIEITGHLELAKRVRTIASQVFRYGVVNLLCESDPAGLLVGATKQPKIKSMAAITDEKEFADYLKRIFEAEHLSATVKVCLCLAPYVFLRSGEMRIAKVGDIDFEKKLWTMPSQNTKLKRDHLVPLTESSIEILKLALNFSTEEFLFPGTRKGRPISENTFNVAIRSLGYEKGKVVFHGFRSSFSTLAREVLRAEDDLIERQLAHVESNGVKAAYDRSYKLEARRELMQTWSDYLDQLRKSP